MGDEIGKTIWKQMGGNRFGVMTGSKPRIIPNGLGIRFPRSNGINYLEIRLNQNDLYDMKFIRIHGTKIVKVKEINGVYYDQLQEIFTQETGLYTRL
jgi:hypothetical protein